MQCILALCCRLFGALRPNTEWRIECHQFRIEARSEAPGQPTPEGMHRDGVDYALVLLINRTNIKSGTTTVHDLDGHTLGSFTLTAPFDTAIVDDARVKHGVTAVEPIDAESRGVSRRAGRHVQGTIETSIGDRNETNGVLHLPVFGVGPLPYRSHQLQLIEIDLLGHPTRELVGQRLAIDVCIWLCIHQTQMRADLRRM